MRIGAPVVLAALALAGCTASAERQAAQRERAAQALAEATEGRTSGPPENCISSTALSGPQIVAPDTLIYRETGRRTWISRIEGCSFLDRDDIVIAELYGQQICRNDRFRTVQRGGAAIPSAYCRFGEFVPWVKPG